MGKKATFLLSIETLVKIILAITFLVLAIIFVTLIYYNMNEDIGQGFDTLTKQRIDQLKESDNDFDLELYTLNINPGDKNLIFMLIRNRENKNNTYKINHTSEDLSQTKICSNITLDYKKEITLGFDKELTPPLVIKSEQNINKGTCLFEILSNNKTIRLTIDVI